MFLQCTVYFRKRAKLGLVKILSNMNQMNTSHQVCFGCLSAESIEKLQIVCVVYLLCAHVQWLADGLTIRSTSLTRIHTTMNTVLIILDRLYSARVQWKFDDQKI